MKGQLYIGDDMVAETVEVVSSPRSGDLIIFEGKRFRIREVGHNVDRKKLQIMCHAPSPARVTAYVSDSITLNSDDFVSVVAEKGEVFAHTEGQCVTMREIPSGEE